MANRFRVPSTDIEDAVQDTLSAAACGWIAMVLPPHIAEDTARRRWVLGILAHKASHYRRAAQRAARGTPVKIAHDDARPSAEGPVAARATLRTLEAATTPERWRAWLAREVDHTPVSEIARTEGIPPATVHTRLRLAREDFRAALAREEAAAVGPLVKRHEPRKGRA